jgi:antitoxin VapB
VASELEEKTQRLAEVLAENDLGGVLLNAQHNFAWLTGGGSNGIDLSREHGASYLLVRRDGKRFVIANNIEMPRLLSEEISGDEFEPIEIPWQEEKASFATVLDAARSVLNAGKLASDIFLNDKLRAIEPLVASCRYSLTQPELTRIRELGRDAGKAIGDVIGKLSPGRSENEIAQYVRDGLANYGIYSVVTLVGADQRIEHYRHPVPTNNIWNKVLLIAVCARRHGLIVSLSRVICAGEIPAELQRRTEATAFVNVSLYSATVHGAKGSDLYQIAAETYRDQGFADEINKHHQGGACGYKTRDWVAHPKNSETIRMSQAFAWNPSITGTKVEETGIVTKNGFEVITATSGFPQITTVIDGHEYISPGILSLSKGVSA